MITILIVDDEKIERNGVKFLLKREEEALEILEAENGKMALSILTENQVDILFSDIKMPCMNGLELIEKARELYPDLEVVIFSGYNDFSYAREALRSGVVDYVLKPVDPSEFHRTFLKVKANLAAKKELEAKQLRQGDYLKKYFFMDYLYTGNEEDIRQIRGIMKESGEAPEKHYVRMILAGGSHDFFETDEEHFLVNLKENLNRDFFYLNLNSDESLFLFKEKYSDYEQLANQLYRFFRQQYNAECYFAVSGEIADVTEMPAVFQNLEQMLEEQFYQPTRHVFLTDGKKTEEGEMVLEDTEILRSISGDIRSKDITHLRQDFQKLKNKYRNDKSYSEMYTKFVFSSILKEIYEEMLNGSENELFRKIDRLYRCRTIQEVIEITESVIGEMEAFIEEKNDGFRKEITQVKSYIYHNYEKSLSTEALAELVYLSPGYLSAIFKEETGMNLNRFIREVRMNKAKELLETTNMKITQIAKKVGFSNNSYFGRSFREFFGYTPESCRRGNANEETASEI